MKTTSVRRVGCAVCGVTSGRRQADNPCWTTDTSGQMRSVDAGRYAVDTLPVPESTPEHVEKGTS